MTVSRWIVGLAAAGLTACSGAKAPTTPTADGDLSVRLTVTVDSLGSAVAIPSVSRVRFEAAGSNSDSRTQYIVDYGDQTTGTGPVTEHLYSGPGTCATSVTIVDAQGRRASASHSVTVRTVEGSWFHAAFSPTSRRVEMRRLSITSQSGRDLQGELVGPDAAAVPVNGMLEGERTLKLSAGGGQVEGIVPSQVFAENAVLSLRGFPDMPDASLSFSPIVGSPTTPPPVAQLDIRIDSYGSPAAILGLSPIRFSGAGSTADGATYVIEFGDGAFATEPTAVHACTLEGERVSRLTVIDRFARLGVTVSRYECLSLLSPPSAPYGPVWFSDLLNPSTGSHERRRLYFDTHAGSSVGGYYRHPGEGGGFSGGVSHFSGTLTGERSLRIVLDGGGVEFTGDVILSYPTYVRRMDLLLKGGSADGLVLTFRYTGSEY